MLKISCRSLLTACLLAGITLQPVALLAEEAAPPAAAAPAQKAGCDMANCPECASGACPGKAAGQDCPCKHKHGAKHKAKRKAQTKPKTQP